MLNKLERLKEIMIEIQRLSYQLGYWEGNMMMCYVACHTAWDAKMVKPGDPKDKMALETQLNKLKIEANILFIELRM
jgi:hypothetical protein